MAIKYPRWVMELDVPRPQAIRPGISSAYYGADMRVDKVDNADIPPAGGMKLPASHDIWQEPLTGFISLKPDFLYDSQTEVDSKWASYEKSVNFEMHKDSTLALLQAYDERSDLAKKASTIGQIMEAAGASYHTKFTSTQVWNLLERAAALSGNNLLVLNAILAIELNLLGQGVQDHKLWPLLRSANPIQANQGFRVFAASGAQFRSKCENYLVVRWGRMVLTLGTDGEAKLYGLSDAENWPTDYVPETGNTCELLDTWQFAAKPGHEPIWLTILPINGSLAIYLQNPDVKIGNLVSITTHRNPGLPIHKNGHLIKLPSKYCRWDNRLNYVTTEAGRLWIMGHVSYSYNIELYKVQYPVTGTYYSAAEQLEQPTLEGQQGIVESWDYLPAGCTAAATMVDGEAPDGNGLPTTWVMAAGHQHPRIKVVLTRASTNASITPYHRGHNFSLGPVWIADTRTMLTINDPYRLSITQTQNPWEAEGTAELLFGTNGSMVPSRDAWATLATAYNLFTKRPDIPYRLWCENSANRAEDVLLMAGYVDTESPVGVDWKIEGQLAKFKFKLAPMLRRLNEAHFTRCNIYDNATMDYFIKDCISACGFDTANQFSIKAADVGIELESLPNEEGALTCKYRPKPNGEVGKTIETALTLFNAENQEVNLVWDAKEAGTLGADNRKLEEFRIEKRRNAPSEAVPPTINWNFCFNDNDRANHTNAIYIVERPTLRIYPVAANTVHVITDAQGGGDGTSLEIGPGAFNTDSVAIGLESTTDPTNPDYLGRYKRVYVIVPDMKGPQFTEQCEALAKEVLKVAGHTYYELDVKVPWQSGLKVDDYVQVWYSAGTEYEKFWVTEISADYDDSTVIYARVTLRSIWQRPQGEA